MTVGVQLVLALISVLETICGVLLAEERLSLSACHLQFFVLAVLTEVGVFFDQEQLDDHLDRLVFDHDALLVFAFRQEWEMTFVLVQQKEMTVDLVSQQQFLEWVFPQASGLDIFLRLAVRVFVRVLDQSCLFEILAGFRLGVHHCRSDEPCHLDLLNLSEKQEVQFFRALYVGHQLLVGGLISVLLEHRFVGCEVLVAWRVWDQAVQEETLVEE